MIVVSDTGPLHYLILIGATDILPSLYQQVIVPRSIVTIELNDHSTPAEVRSFLALPPPWLVVHNDPAQIDPSLASLGLGERSAITLLVELRGDLLLSDDRSARKKAQSLGLSTIGTLGLIIDASLRGLIDFDATINSLTQNTSFHHTPALISLARQQYLSRSRSGKP